MFFLSTAGRLNVPRKNSREGSDKKNALFSAVKAMSVAVTECGQQLCNSGGG